MRNVPCGPVKAGWAGLAMLAALAAPGVAPDALAAEPAAVGSAEAGASEDWPMRWDLGLAVGYFGISEHNGFGNGADPEDTPASSGLLAARFNAWVVDRVGIEAEATLVPTNFRNNAGGHANLYGLRGLLLYQMFPEGTVRPFVAAGAGTTIFKASESKAFLDARQTFVKDEEDATYIAGAGLKWQALHRLGVRLDVRWVGSEAPEDRDASFAHHFEGMVGLAYTLGGKPGDADEDGLLDPSDKCPDQAEDKDGFEDGDGCPEADNDGDKIADADDKCPNEAEDMDGFEDYDGCPELDNDKDGVPDAKDKCATQAEDRDGFQDDDGCPDLDNDKDGIPDAKDKCPGTAEDMDGFQDEDGCPEPDNDGDGIADTADKCPNEPETRNGFQDDDGCKDDMPEDLGKLMAGPLAGVQFKGTALIEKASAAALQPVAQAMVAHEAVKLTVKVTSSAVDQATAQARAEAVKAFLVSRGVEVERIEAVGESTYTPPPAGTKPPKGKPAPDTVTISLR